VEFTIEINYYFSLNIPFFWGFGGEGGGPRESQNIFLKKKKKKSFLVWTAKMARTDRWTATFCGQPLASALASLSGGGGGCALISSVDFLANHSRLSRTERCRI